MAKKKGLKPTKEITVKEANEKAKDAKGEDACKKGVFEEAVKLYRNETHSIQQLLAYVRQLDNLGKLPAKKDKEE